MTVRTLRKRHYIICSTSYSVPYTSKVVHSAPLWPFPPSQSYSWPLSIICFPLTTPKFTIYIPPLSLPSCPQLPFSNVLSLFRPSSLLCFSNIFSFSILLMSHLTFESFVSTLHSLQSTPCSQQISGHPILFPSLTSPIKPSLALAGLIVKELLHLVLYLWRSNISLLLRFLSLTRSGWEFQ